MATQPALSDPPSDQRSRIAPTLISINDGPRSSNELQPLGQTEDPQAKASWRSLFLFTTRQHVPPIIWAIITTIMAGVLKPAAAIFYGRIFAELAGYGGGTLGGKDALHNISIWCIALAALGVAAWIFEGLLLSSWIVFGELQAKAVRQQMFVGMLDKEMGWYDLREDGISSFLIRIQTQIRELQLALSQPLGLVLFEFVGTIASLGISLYYSWNLTLVIAAIFPIAAGILYLLSIGLAPAIEAQKRELNRASKYGSTAISGIDTVKTFNGQDHEIWQYYTTVEKVTTYYLKQARANSLQFGVTKFLLVGVFVLGFWYGAYLASKGLNPGNVLTAFYSCLNAFLALETILPQWLVLAKGMSAGELLKSIMDQIQRGRKVFQMEGALRPESPPGDIEINDLSFAYPTNPHNLVLNKVNCYIPTGETTFLVGASGSGKSTIGNLILKYYEPVSGEILIDGRAIQTLNTNWLRQNITLVQQDNVLFNETIFQNIAFGKRDHTRDEVMKAAEVGCLQDTLQDMPDGIETLVGSGGRNLSGGQKQRVAISRAALRNSEILILDEATSALDFSSRLKVMNNIRKWRKGKTTIIITHDLSQIKADDYVYVLENSKVVQEGYSFNLATKSQGAFASMLIDKDSSSELARRQSEPISPTKSSPESIDMAFRPHEGYMSRIFGGEAPPAGVAGLSMSSHQLSLGVAVAQANALRSQTIWSSPVIPEPSEESVPKKPSVSLLPRTRNSVRFLSPRAAPLTPTDTHNRLSDQLPQFSAPFPEYHSAGNPLSSSSGLSGTDSTARLRKDRRLWTIELLSEAKAAADAENNPASMRKIFSTILPKIRWSEKVIFTFGFIAAVVVAVATPAFAYVFARLLSTFYMTENQVDEARKWALILLAIAVTDGVASFCTHYFLEHSGQAWINSLRVEALERILAQPKTWFDNEKHSSSRLSDCLDRDAEEMRNLVGRFAGPVVTVIIMLSVSIVWAFIIAWDLTLVALACSPLMYAIVRGYTLVTGKWERKCNQAAQSTSNIFTEIFTNIRVVRALTLEAYFERKHRIATLATYKVGLKRAAYSGLLFGLSDSMTLFIFAVVFYYGTLLVSRGSKTVGSILQVINLLLLGVANSSAMLSMVPQISSSRTTATQMLHLSSLPLSASHEATGTVRLPTPAPIELNSLSFTYPNSPSKTLNRVSMKLEEGTCTAIVGPSGSGKSTIAAIILGLYPPDEQSDIHSPPPLTFKGTSVAACHMASLRSFISVVSQAPVIFPSTIFENITYGLPEGSPLRNVESAEKAATQAGIHTFIISLDAGYDTVIGEGGSGLSGGQAQRICIARALVRYPKLLVLDEATSALDRENADGIRNAIRSVAKEGATVLMITHDVEMMRVADRIVVLESGMIMETGEFEELKMRGGAFSRLIGEEKKSVGLGLRKEQGCMSPVRARNRESWPSMSFKG